MALHESHGSLLQDGLRRLEREQQAGLLHKPQMADASDGRADTNPSVRGDDGQPTELSEPVSSGDRATRSHIHEGYGFRPTSGASTPLTAASHDAAGTASPLPDPNGLGWPGNIASSLIRRSASLTFWTTP
jgi:GTP cyclohydrolase IA